MKINILRSGIILGISLLTGWGFFAGSKHDTTGVAIASIVCLGFFIAGGIMFGIDFKQKREGIMLKTLAGCWLFCEFVMNLLFLGFATNITIIFIANALSLLLFLLLANLIYKT